MAAAGCGRACALLLQVTTPYSDVTGSWRSAKTRLCGGVKLLSLKRHREEKDFPAPLYHRVPHGENVMLQDHVRCHAQRGWRRSLDADKSTTACAHWLSMTSLQGE
ncbi:hypothetical protein JOB18_036582 [Solea senegalensis]|uniref:Uncharacterized protein n=1 Tax=Solea senegalensis TaxID=28829 RepID=A0AAV6PX81_SOLSE|nr:hypothetical protein JOB18_036582 [Solea senegalensis]